MAELDEAEAEVSTGGKTPRGHLRVRAPTMIGRQRIASLVGAFVQRYPEVAVELVLSDADPDLVEDELDIAFVVFVPNEPSLIARRLTPERNVVICAAPRYIEQHGAPAVPDDLLSHDCIRLVRGRRVFDRWAFAEGGKRREVHVNGTLATTSGEVVHGWAVAGLGVALKLRWDVAAELANGRLVSCLDAYVFDQRSLYILYAGRSHLPPRLRAFIDFSVAYFKSEHVHG